MMSEPKLIRDRDYCLSLLSGKEDYYLRGEGEDSDPRGVWWGKGAKALSLSGEVKAEELKPLMDGYSPKDEKAACPLGGHREPPRGL
jgi:hypothetical protein